MPLDMLWPPLAIHRIDKESKIRIPLLALLNLQEHLQDMNSHHLKKWLQIQFFCCEYWCAITAISSSIFLTYGQCAHINMTTRP